MSAFAWRKETLFWRTSAAICVALAWAPAAFAVVATGGNTTNDIGGYRIHTFTNSDTAGDFAVTVGGNVDLLIVAGGGGGGNTIAGGGGAGGLIYTSTYALAVGTYPVSVGLGGGSSSVNGGKGTNGTNSSFGSLIAIGGGAGGGYSSGNGNNGGSGGGHASLNSSGVSSGTAGQGNAGGTTANNNNGGAGGGGAGSVGTNGTSSLGGKGGVGVAYDISGTLTCYAGGGGGGARSSSATGGAGGNGGGGSGGTTGVGMNGMPNTGGGGGGGGFDGSTWRPGGIGGSGIVIVRYHSTPALDNAGGATNVTLTSAFLNGSLLDGGISPATVLVYWGASDGGTNAEAWANTNVWVAPQSPGAFTIEASGLAPNTTYYYRFAGTNEAGIGWAGETAAFITGDVWIEKTADASEIGPTPGIFTVHRVSTDTNAYLTVHLMFGCKGGNGTDYAAPGASMTIPEGSDAATITVTPLFDHFLEGMETVQVTVDSGLYVVGSPSNATLEIADYGIVTATWDGGGANVLASNPTNWVDDAAPVAGDAILLDSRNHKAMTWNLDVPVQSWTQNGYNGTVTVATVYPGQGAFTNFAILGDCVISNGVWTQTANPNVNFESNRLCVSVGGRLIVGADAAIDVTGKGYGAGRGPGTAGGGQQVAGASHGGRGLVYAGKQPGPCYGSVVAPVNLGSGGGYSAGGGAILFRVAGVVSNDGLFCAEGGKSDHYEGAGGSLYIVAGALTGTGTFRANGGIFTGTAAPAGGGRVSLVLTNAGAVFSDFAGTISAYGSQRSGVEGGSAGTIYLETAAHAPGKGELIVNNYWGARGYGAYNTDLNDIDAVSYEFSRITLTNGGQLNIGSDDALIATNTVLVGANCVSNGIWISGGTLLAPSVFAYSNFFIGISGEGSTFSPATSLTIGTNTEFRVDKPHAMAGDLVIAAGGKLTHTANLSSSVEYYKINLALGGSLLVQTGGVVDVTGRGFPVNYGPGTHPFNSSGASYGGLGVGGLSCYGSLVAPTNLGSGGRSGSAGGGVIQLAVSGTVSNGGTIRANAAESTSRSGSGGGIFITAGTLTGSGPIQANSAINVSSDSPGGGGRIALVVTNAGENIFAYAGAITAYGGRKPASTSGGAGTVYLRNPGQGLYEGTLIVDNDNLTGLATEISSNVTDTSVANVLIQRKGYLLLNTNQTLTVSGIWSNTASFAGFTDAAVIFEGGAGSTSTIYGSTTFKGLVCTNAGKTLVFEAGTTNSVEAQGRFRLKGADSALVTLRSSAPGTAWKLNVNPAADQSVNGVDVADSDASGGVEITAVNSTDSTGNSNWRFVSVVPGETITWTGGTSTVWSATGNWDLVRYPLDTDTIVIPGGLTRYPVLDADRTVNRLSIQSGASLALAGYNLTVTNCLAVAGTLTASGTETITLSKDADFTGGTYDSARSSLILAGDVAQSNNLGGATFYKVRVENSAAPVTLAGGFTATELRCEAPGGTRSLRFEPGKTVRLRDLVLRGASPGATNILLESMTGGAAWKLAVSGYRAVRGVEAHDSDASAGLPIPALDSADGGGNVNWTFGVGPAVWLGASGNNFHTAANWSPAVVPNSGTRVSVESANAMTITGTVSILDLTVGGGGNAASVKVDGSLTVGESVAVLDMGTLTWNRPGVVSNDLVVLAGGLLTHSVNSATEANKIDLSVGGDVGVDVGGVVDVTARGYAVNKGPGTSGSNGGSSYGGRGAIYSVQPGRCYGSFVAPTNLGSGGKYSAGGGAILVKASGTICHDGWMIADGGTSDYYQGSGGTVFLTAGELTGIGAIRANGGDMTGSAAPAGGGRVSLVVTNAGADFSAYSGMVQARSTVLIPAGANAGGAGPGTIYRQTASDRPGCGTVTVDNFNLTSSGYAAVPPYTNYVSGEADRIVFRVANAATLRLTNDFMVGDIWLDTANAKLDLGSNTLTVHAREHALGTVLNYGAIIWKGLPPGALIIVK